MTVKYQDRHLHIFYLMCAVLRYIRFLGIAIKQYDLCRDKYFEVCRQGAANLELV